jgi:putative transposase
MPRLARIVIESVPHHITQRGNNRQDVFFVDDDRRAYLKILAEESAKYGLIIDGYCLMSNHIHLIATPKNQQSLSKTVGRTHFRYSQYINRMHGRSGHLWQNRFYSCPLGREHFWPAMRYVETNPVRARIVGKAWDYPWSSASEHIGKETAIRVIDVRRWKSILYNRDWKRNLKAGCTEQEIKAVRCGTQVGRPLGTDNFISKLEKTVGRRLRPLPIGRPKKKRKEINR